MSHMEEVIEEMEKIFTHIAHGGFYYAPEFSEKQIAQIVSAAVISSGLRSVANSVSNLEDIQVVIKSSEED